VRLQRDRNSWYLRPRHCNFGRQTSLLSGINMANKYSSLLVVDEISFGYIFEQNVTVPLCSGGRIRCNVYRPRDSGLVPALVTYGPYGKDIHYQE